MLSNTLEFIVLFLLIGFVGDVLLNRWRWPKAGKACERWRRTAPSSVLHFAGASKVLARLGACSRSPLSAFRANRRH